jgi:NADP-dependent 3-hydroxy acid dehydrogenase YdfG
MDLHLNDKIVLITGASRGIGLATAKAFGAEGCRLMLSARSEATLSEAASSQRVRGTRRCPVDDRQGNRFIPAGAGNTNR